MKSYFIITLLSCAFICGSVNPAFAETELSYPGYDNIYVNDYVGVLGAELTAELTQYLQQAGENNGPQITLLVIQSLRNYGAGPTIEPFATGLFNHWGIGNAKTNDGVLILVSIDDRKMRIELGSGYSGYQDKVMKDVIENSFIPYFKDGDYPAGIENGTVETIYAVTGKYPGEIGSSLFARSKFKISQMVDKLGAWVLAIIAPVLMFFGAGVRKVWRLRPRSCSVCQNKMTMMGEQADDEHIDGGQRLEEYLESVDYDVWQCHVCSRIDIFRYQSWFSSYSTCKACSYRTLEADTTIVTAATTSHSGTKRIDYHCKNCDFRDSETRTIPRRTESSSSSGGSSSFGGGSSSGGGASGSW